MATYMGLAVPLVGNSDITGNITITGTLSASGAQTIGGALAVGNTSITGTLSASGAATIGGAQTITGALSVGGAQTTTGTLVVTGAQTLTGATSHGGNVSLASRIAKMVIGTVALASLASNASATVTVSGITTDSVAGVFFREAGTDPVPCVWGSAADKLGYSATGGVTLASRTVNVWHFTTA